MPETVKSLIAKSDTQARRALDAIDYEFQKLPVPPDTTSRKSPGQLMAALSTNGSGFLKHPIEEIKSIRGKTASKLKAAKRNLDHGQEVALWMKSVAQFLRSNTATFPEPPNDIVPESVIFGLKAIKTHAAAGVIGLDEVISVIENSASDSLVKIADAQIRYHRFYTTASTATSKHAAKLLHAHGRSAMARTYEEKAARSQTVHRKLFKGAR